MSFQLTSEDFALGGEIPRQFTCDGHDVAPRLCWSGEPSGTKSFALIMDDPDAPGRTWTHWVLWDVPASVHSLGEGSKRTGVSGSNDFRRRGYGGPCPPREGGPHRYFFRLFALDAPTLGLSPGTNRAELEKALRKHILAETEYMGLYGRD